MWTAISSLIGKNRAKQVERFVIHSMVAVVPGASEGVRRLRYTNEKGDKSERRMPRLSGGEEGRGKLR